MKTLLVLAAGMGSRFGGLKQIEPVGPNKEFIIDYSIYDAKKNGFDKVVFVIKKENYELFKNTIGKRIENKIKVEYAFQDFNNLPKGYTLNRVKPLGTAHAILSAKDKINEPFMVINSDDFYGPESYEIASYYLDNINDSEFYIIGYDVVNTLTDNGSVKRGICISNGDDLLSLRESKIEMINDEVACEDLLTNEKFKISKDTKVCMNMMLFTPKIFDLIEDGFKPFLDSNKDNLDTCEYLIPEVLKDNINCNKCKVKLISTPSVWAGVTYKEDKELLVNYIEQLIDKGKYKKDLWS